MVLRPSVINRGNGIYTPYCNTGVTDAQTSSFRDQLNQISITQNLVVHTSRGPKEVPVRVPVGDQLVVIDAVNFVVGCEAFTKYDYNTIFADRTISFEEKQSVADEFAELIAAELATYIGPDFAKLTPTGKGLHFYRHAYTIGHPDAPLGKVAFGGQRNTVLVMISGTGCKYADSHWENGLYFFLSTAPRAKLTRIDLAHDDFTGAYSSPEIVDTADSQGMFALTNRIPQVQHLGDWKRHEGRGRTLQVGRRENGKLYRGYEKGKEQGENDSFWFRHEIEFGTAGRILPLEMLLSPTEFFAGAYPYTLEVIEHAKQAQVTSTRIECVKKEAEISLEKSISIWKRQCGRYVAAYRQIYVKEVNGEIVPDDALILDMIQTDKKDFWPSRLKLIEKFTKNPPTYAPWADHRKFGALEEC